MTCSICGRPTLARSFRAHFERCSASARQQRQGCVTIAAANAAAADVSERAPGSPERPKACTEQQIRAQERAAELANRAMAAKAKAEAKAKAKAKAKARAGAKARAQADDTLKMCAAALRIRLRTV